MDVWVVLEVADSGIKEGSLEVLSEARKLVRLVQGSLTVITEAGDEKVHQSIQSFAPDVVYLFLPEASVSGAQTMAIVLADMVNRQKPAVLLAAETIFGREVLAEVSARLKLSFLPDCVALTWDTAGRLIAERHWYYGRISATLAGKGPTIIASLRTGLFNVKREVLTSKVRVEILDRQSPPINQARVLKFIKANPRTVDLSAAEVIVSGGRGMGTAENFQMLWQLADLLGAAVGGTRAARDNGWIPLERQVGQTGKIVSPNLIICCGISGATQHTFGMKDARMVVAINKDKNAPIFKMADIGIVGDVNEIVPALIELIKRTREVKQNLDVVAHLRDITGG